MTGSEINFIGWSFIGVGLAMGAIAILLHLRDKDDNERKQS